MLSNLFEEKEACMAKQGPLSGQTIGEKYVLGELLGEGGFGVVYKAHHLHLQRLQALKILLERHFQKSEFRERFLREAQTVATLDHPNIIHLDDFGLESARAYLVMPFIRGGTFQGILRKQQSPLRPEQIVSYLEHICAALDYAHAKGVVHLDLKPLNLLVRDDGGLLLVDFGLAHFMKQGSVEGGISLLFGSPHYMAPEHIQGRPEKRSDLFSLGVILYQMLVGRLPFEGSTPEMVLIKNLTEWPASPRVLRPELPHGVENVVRKTLAKQPKDRYQTAGELLAAFKQALIIPDQPQLPSNPANILLKKSVAPRFPSPTISAPLHLLSTTENATTIPSHHRLMEALEALYTLSHHPVSPIEGVRPQVVVAWSADGQILASGDQYGEIKLWNAQAGQLLRTQRYGSVEGMEWSTNGQLLIIGINSIMLWNVQTDLALHDFRVKDRFSSDYIQCAALSADGQTVASGHHDGTIKLWDTRKGKQLRSLTGQLRTLAGHRSTVESLMWNPDGQTLASGSFDHTIKIWDPWKGKLLRTLTHLTSHTDSVNSVAWNPDGQTLASGSGDAHIKIWNAQTGQLLRALTGHTASVKSVAWNPNGRMLARTSVK